MNKQEFLHELEKSLRGKVDEDELKRQTEYYSSYIKSETDSGKTEEEVLIKLGDPRLIARTIVQTYNMKEDPIRNSYKGSSAGQEENGDERYGTLKSKIHKYLIIAAVIIIVFAVMSLVFSVIRIFLPIILMIILIMLIIRMVR